MSVQSISNIPQGSPQNHQQSPTSNRYNLISSLGSGVGIGGTAAAASYFLFPAKMDKTDVLTISEKAYNNFKTKLSKEKDSEELIKDIDSLRKEYKSTGVEAEKSAEAILKKCAQKTKSEIIEDFSDKEFNTVEKLSESVKKAFDDATELGKKLQSIYEKISSSKKKNVKLENEYIAINTEYSNKLNQGFNGKFLLEIFKDTKDENIDKNTLRSKINTILTKNIENDTKVTLSGISDKFMTVKSGKRALIVGLATTAAYTIFKYSFMNKLNKNMEKKHIANIEKTEAKKA